MKRTIREHIQIADEEFFSMRVVDAISALEDTLLGVPDAYRDQAMMDYEVADGYATYVQIYWDRPETEEEQSLREGRASLDDKRKESAERVQLEKLLNKYGVPRDAWVRKG